MDKNPEQARLDAIKECAGIAEMSVAYLRTKSSENRMTGDAIDMEYAVAFDRMAGAVESVLRQINALANPTP